MLRSGMVNSEMPQCVNMMRYTERKPPARLSWLPWLATIANAILRLLRINVNNHHNNDHNDNCNNNNHHNTNVIVNVAYAVFPKNSPREDDRVCVCVIVWREAKFVYLLVVLPGYLSKDN
ncbi:hypothetical protein WR25_10582 [Diploscapter pachys]|uniref:Uncharacterized protein n=1 Tax=Diploscapter pachys TaxID=2018661 RepID=A0A2A2JFI9_9BILA|nr:hypothetical protein WR25_10582 [Diploscapter pachys]